MARCQLARIPEIFQDHQVLQPAGSELKEFLQHVCFVTAESTPEMLLISRAQQ